MVSAIETELQGIIEKHNVFLTKQKSQRIDAAYEIEQNQLNVRCVAAVERGAGRKQNDRWVGRFGG